MANKQSQNSGSGKPVKRCGWAREDPMLQQYHDEEWGVPEVNDNRLFERMALQIFQAGLNWKMILVKRAAFKKAFADFEIDRVARFNVRSIKRLMKDERIIRNRKKIEAVIENARRLNKIQEEFGSFRTYLESLPSRLEPLQQEFKKRFIFMGPEITRMFVMNIGKVRTIHERTCFQYKKHTPW